MALLGNPKHAWQKSIYGTKTVKYFLNQLDECRGQDVFLLLLARYKAHDKAGKALSLVQDAISESGHP